MLQMTPHTEFRLATPADSAIVLSILDDAATWLMSRGISQWPSAFQAEWILPNIQSSETWLVRVDGSPVATLTLGWSDPLWPDDGRAGYVHRLARKRNAPSLGDELFDWVGQQVASEGRVLIRLDCVTNNRRLRQYYEDRGFSHRGDTAVSGAPGDRDVAGPMTPVSLYERTVPG